VAEALTDVLFAAYQDVATATRDFDRLLKIVEDKQDDAGGQVEQENEETARDGPGLPRGPRRGRIYRLPVVIGSVLRQLTSGELEGADFWSDEPAILGAGMGSTTLSACPDRRGDRSQGRWLVVRRSHLHERPRADGRESHLRGAGGNLYQAYVGGRDVSYDDGLPVEFSWPVATETVDPTDFEFTLNTGETVFGLAVGLKTKLGAQRAQHGGPVRGLRQPRSER
jgi:hypothetical protein